MQCPLEPLTTRAKATRTRPNRLGPHNRVLAGDRHTGATMAAQAGATMRELMDRLGHSTPQAALIYQHAAADRQADLAARLSAMAVGELE